MALILTECQKKALAHILEFLYGKTQKSQFMLLEGKAGTGKTTLMKMVVQHNNRLGTSRLRVLAAAMTHKARKVIEKALNEGNLITIPSKTIAGLLKKQRMNSYLGHKKYGGGGNSMADFDLIIIDEASMINDTDLEKIVEAARLHKTKLLFIADSAQIPHPTQKLIRLAPDLLVKADSAVFKLKNRISLQEIVRQKFGNPVLDVALHIRENLFCEDPYGPYNHVDILKVNEEAVCPCDKTGKFVHDKITGKCLSVHDKITGKCLSVHDKITGKCLSVHDKITGVQFVTSEKFESLIVDEMEKWNRNEWEDPFEVRILSYTNESVRTYNKLARNARHKNSNSNSNNNSNSNSLQILDPLIKGDLLMGYETVGFPIPYIENGQDYLVENVQRVENHPVIMSDIVTGVQKVLAKGYLVTMGETMQHCMNANPITIKTHFFPDINDNAQILHELKRRADVVNQPNSSSKAFKHYRELKDQLIFMESLYEFKGKIYSESHFFREHPLLTTNVTELIKEEIIPNTNTVKDNINDKPKIVRSLRKNFLYDQIKALYPNLVEDRLNSTHMLGDSEELGDRFLFIDKDLDYGYSITTHKSQASTYKRVYINDADIAKIKDRWSYDYNDWYRGSKERNQLKYVALTRARHLVTILSVLKDKEEAKEERKGGEGEECDEKTDNKGFFDNSEFDD